VLTVHLFEVKHIEASFFEYDNRRPKLCCFENQHHDSSQKAVLEYYEPSWWKTNLVIPAVPSVFEYDQIWLTDVESGN